MASEKDACENDQNFAIICAFFQKFSTMLNIQHPNIQLLKEWFENTDEVSHGLKDLHIKLLRKLRKTVHETAWETALAKFCYLYSSKDAWELERFGYKKSSLKVKLRILKELLEYQFQRNGRFRNHFSTLPADDLRGQPIGHDRLGHSYWFTHDRHNNIRIYQEHLDEEIWQVVATTREELVTLISRLKGNEVVLPSLVSIVDEDSSSNSCPAAVAKPPPPEEEDESQDEKVNLSEERVPNIKIKLDTSKILANKNGMETDSESDYRGEDDTEVDKDIAGGTSREDCKTGIKVEKNEELDGNESSDDKDNLQIDDKNLTRVKIEQENGLTDELEKKVKPIIISQSKIAGEKFSKKRILEESEKVSEDENLSKKCRPTLLGNNRVKKISRYEKIEEDSDEEDADEEEEEEEGTEEEECAPEDDEEEGEEELGEEEEVGEEIEEDLMVIKCEGTGNECESSYLNLTNYEFNNAEEIVGEAIEEDVMLVVGEGSGFECFVGNSKDISSKDELCVEKSGCENVGDHNKDCSLTIEKEERTNKTDRNCPDVQSNDSGKEEKHLDAKEDKLDELTNGESGLETEVNLKTNDKIELPTEEITVEKSDTANDPHKETCSSNPESSGLIEIIDKKLEATSLNQPEMSEVPIVKITESNKEDTDENCTEVKNDANQETVPEIQDDSSARPSVTSEPPPEARANSPQKCIPKNRKRRLSEDKPQQNSENETDLNSEDNEEQSMEEEPDVGGKRPKMRCKVINSSIRRKCETDRNEAEKGSSSSEEEVPSKDEAIKDIPGSSETKSDPLVSIKMPEEKVIGEQNENILKIETAAVENCHTSSELHLKDCEQITLESADEKLASPKSNFSEKIHSPVDINPEKSPPPTETSTFPLEELISPQIASPVKASSPKPECPEHDEEIAHVQTRSGRKKPAAVSAPGKRRGRGGGGPKNFCRGRKAKKVESNEQKTVEFNKNSGNMELPAEDKDIEKDSETTAEKGTESVPAMDSCQDDLPSEEIVKTDNSVITKAEIASNADDKSNLANDDNNDAVKRKKQRKKREIDVSNIIDADSDIAPVRQSRRIAQLKIREEAERRKMEEVALKKMKEQLKQKKKEEKQQAKDITYKSESSDKNESVDSEMEMKKKVEKKKRGLKKGGWSSGTEDEQEEEEEEFQYYETDAGSPLFKSDHEFSPESDIEDESQIVPTKRARTARREGEEGPEVAVGSDESCQKCGKSDHPEWILLCDKCDKGYHCSCLSPVLFIIPEGDWFCPPCQQEQLIEALEIQLKEFDELVIKRKEEEELRIRNLEILKAQEHQMRIVSAGKQPRKKPERRSRKSSDDDSYSMEAVNSRSGRSSSRSSGSGSATTTSSSSSSSSATDSDDEPIYKLRKRRQMNMSYRFNEFDDLINSAIKHEMDEVAGAGNLGRGKDISTIIEADKEEKLRLKQLEAQKDMQVAHSESVPLAIESAGEVVRPETIQENDTKIKEDSGSDFEPLKAKPKLSSRKSLKKKNRKLNCLDVSSEDDGSDEDFKTSSYDTDEDEESLSGGATEESESSLEVYKRKSKKNKKNSRRSTRRAARQRRKRYDDFIVDDSEGSTEIPKIKKKKKEDSDYSESETEEELSEDVDSEDLCDDSTETDSDRAWKPGKRKKQRIISKRKEPKKKSSKSSKKHKRADNERPFKSSKSKNRIIDYDDENSLDGSRKTRGKRFTYLEDYEDESSDDGIKPGVKRPDTPPEEREQFIKRQEEIKRMLAEKNTEAAKMVATPTLTPLQQKGGKSQGPADASASLSTVPLSVIKGAKVLDIDYLQRRGELESDDGESEEFDDNLPEDFNPDDMDEEEIAKMMEEEDFAQQQVKLASEAIRQKRLKDPETNKPEAETPRIYRAAPAPIYDTTRKRLPIPTPHPPLRNPPLGQMFNNPQFSRSNFMLGRSLPQHSDRSILQRSLSGVQSNASPLVRSNPPLSVNPGVQPISSVPNSQIPTVVSQVNLNEPQKPRGRRKKITPLRDTLQKQQAAAAAAASTGPIPPSPLPGQAGPSRQPEQPVPLGQNNKESIPVGEKLSGPDLSIAQPPQLYKPSNTQPSVITRMAQPPRSRFPDPGARFFGPPNQIGARHPAARLPPMSIPPHHGMRPSFASGPPPLRPANTGPPPPGSLGNGIGRHPLSARPPPPFATSDQFSVRPRSTPPLNPYRPPLYGSPGYPPAPPGHSTPQGPPVPQPASSLHTGDNVYSAPAFAAATFGNFYPPPIGSTHSTPPPPTATAVPSSVIVSATANTSSPPISVGAEPLQPSPPRPKATPLETFNSKSTPPPESESARSPYSVAPAADDNDEEIIRSNSTSEFSGLVSYFSSQQDDLNT